MRGLGTLWKEVVLVERDAVAIVQRVGWLGPRRMFGSHAQKEETQHEWD